LITRKSSYWSGIMRRNLRVLFAILMLGVTVTACRKKPVEPPPASVPPQQPQQPPSTPPAGGGGNTSTNSEEAAARERMIRMNTEWVNAPVYFAYDMAELSAQARANLDQKIAVLRANPTVRVRIEGHADSRGSDEYNIALGQRRAASARAYMEERGIPANRLETVSLGEERPAMQGENEAAWEKNRRDEFLIVAGQITNPIGDL
jgi:peptidoglycan-associated lipoprotein